MTSAAAAALLATAVVLALLAAFIFVPAPHVVLVPLGVGAPELSPWLAVASALTALAATLLARRQRRARAAVSIAVVAMLIALTPLARVPATTARFDATMAAALGPDPLRSAPPSLVASLRASPFAVSDFVRGVHTDPAVRVYRQAVATAHDVTLRLVIYRRPATDLHPAIVQIYGGAWQRGAPDDDATIARRLASLGYVVFAVDYRHAPASRWPAQIDDVRASLAWIQRHGGEHGADVTRMALFGRSAGGHLALLAAHADRPAGVRAVVSYYGPTDLAEGWRRPPSPDPLDARSILETFLGGTPDQQPAAYRDASPITWVRAGAPPTLLVHGSRDHIVEPRFGRMLDERLHAVGATSVYLEIPWAEHAFDIVPHGVSGQIARHYTERFLAWALSRR